MIIAAKGNCRHGCSGVSRQTRCKHINWVQGEKSNLCRQQRLSNDENAWMDRWCLGYIGRRHKRACEVCTHRRLAGNFHQNVIHKWKLNCLPTALRWRWIAADWDCHLNPVNWTMTTFINTWPNTRPTRRPHTIWCSRKSSTKMNGNHCMSKSNRISIPDSLDRFLMPKFLFIGLPIDFLWNHEAATIQTVDVIWWFRRRSAYWNWPMIFLTVDYNHDTTS